MFIPKVICDLLVKISHFGAGKNRKITLHLKTAPMFSHTWIFWLYFVQAFVSPSDKSLDKYVYPPCILSVSRPILPSLLMEISYVKNGWIRPCHYLFLHGVRYLPNLMRLLRCLAFPLFRKPFNASIFLLNSTRVVNAVPN